MRTCGKTITDQNSYQQTIIDRFAKNSDRLWGFFCVAQVTQWYDTWNNKKNIVALSMDKTQETIGRGRRGDFNWKALSSCRRRDSPERRRCPARRSRCRRLRCCRHCRRRRRHGGLKPQRFSMSARQRRRWMRRRQLEHQPAMSGRASRTVRWLTWQHHHLSTRTKHTVPWWQNFQVSASLQCLCRQRNATLLSLIHIIFKDLNSTS